MTGQVAGGVTGATVGSLFGNGAGRMVATGAEVVFGMIIGGKVAEQGPGDGLGQCILFGC